MTEWITTNWLWIVLALGAGWLLLGRRGMGCGMGGHGAHHESAPRPKGLEDADRDQPAGTPAGPRGGSHRHGGCC